MKNGLNKKLFADKALLQKNLPKYLKRTLLALANKKVTQLPFYYEGQHFEDGSPFITIGEAKEVHKIFKQERVKGKGGKDEQGKIIKLDKKLVAYGTVVLSADGVFDFQLEQGFLKKQALKAAINQFTLLKQNIGQNFIITKGGQPVEEEEGSPNTTSTSESSTNSSTNSPTPEESTQKEGSKPNSSPEWTAKKAKMKTTLAAMKSNLEQLQAKLG